MYKKPFYMDFTQRLNRFDFSEIFKESNKNIYEEISKFKQLNTEFINLLKELEFLAETYSLEESYKQIYNNYVIYKIKFDKDLEEIFKHLKILSEIIMRLDDKKIQKNFSETLLKLNNLTLDMEDKNNYFLDIDKTLNLLNQINKQDSTNLTLEEILFLIQTLTKVETVTDYFEKNKDSKFYGTKPKFDFLKPTIVKKENSEEKTESLELDKKVEIKEPDYMKELENILDKWKTD